MKQVDLKRLEAIKKQMEELNQEAIRMVSDTFGYSSMEFNQAEYWGNNIKYSLEKGDPCHSHAMQDTIDDIQEGIECGDLEQTQPPELPEEYFYCSEFINKADECGWDDFAELKKAVQDIDTIVNIRVDDTEPGDDGLNVKFSAIYQDGTVFGFEACNIIDSEFLQKDNITDAVDYLKDVLGLNQE